MAKNTRIIRLNSYTIGLILDSERLLVIENDRIVSMGKLPDDVYPIHPDELTHLSWEAKMIIHAAMISHDLDSPFLMEMSSPSTR